MSDSWQSPLLPGGEWHQSQAPEGGWRQTPPRRQQHRPPQPPQQPHDPTTGQSGYQQTYPGQSGSCGGTPIPQHGNGMATTALILPLIGFGKSKRPGGAGRGPAITGMVNSLALAAVLVTGLTVTACSAVSAPADPGAPVASASAQHSGGDSVCAAIVSQASSITSQIAADSGNYSAQVPVLQTWEGDLQAAAQKAQNSLVQGALRDTASGVQNIIIDEQNLMDGSTSDDTQLNNDFSSYRADVGDLETACGLPS
jgi:hypothetical protein